MKKIIITIIFVLFIIYLAWWITWFFIMGRNLSFVFDTLARLGGAVRTEENEYETEHANVLGQGGAVVARGGGLVDILFFLFLLTLFFIVERGTLYAAAKGKFDHIRLLRMLKERIKEKKLPARPRPTDVDIVVKALSPYQHWEPTPKHAQRDLKP